MEFDSGCFLQGKVLLFIVLELTWCYISVTRFTDLLVGGLIRERRGIALRQKIA